MDSTRVGLVGIGLLGTAIAERLLGAGYCVVGWDVRSERREHLEQLGGQAAPSLVEAAGCRDVIFSLPQSGDVTEVVAEVGQDLRSGTTVIDTTTGDPIQLEAIARTLRQRDVDYLDATVGGSSQHVREGRALAMVGGDRQVFQSCLPLLECLVKRAIHVGPSGHGARMKLGVNLVLGLNRAALAEGLALADGLGLEGPLALECLQEGPAWSRAMDDKGQKMLDQDFAPQARLSQHLKDVRLILDSGRETSTRLPLSDVHCQLLESVERAGFGDEDNSAIRRAYRLA